MTMTDEEKAKLVKDIINRFHEKDANLSELIDFGIIIIATAAIANNFPHQGIQNLVDEVSDKLATTLNEHLKHEQD